MSGPSSARCKGQSETSSSSKADVSVSRISINSFFIKLFCLLLPFGLLREFDSLNESVGGGVIKGHMVWLVIPFSVLISWMYTSLGRVGESTESPFEGSANDIPISHMCRTAEIDLREMLGETDLPSPLEPKNNILL